MNETVSKHPVHTLLDEFFEEAEISDIIAEYQRKNSNYSKWLMYSDYCLDDKTKANDVMTFVLMPFVNEAKHVEMQQKIHDMQPLDIKKTNTVNKSFLSYLKDESILIFSFVFDDRKHFFAPVIQSMFAVCQKTLEPISKCYEGWKITADNEDILKQYDKIVKKINQQLVSLSGKKPNIKLINDILITAFLGAYVSAKVLEKLKIEIFGCSVTATRLSRVMETSLYQYSTSISIICSEVVSFSSVLSHLTTQWYHSSMISIALQMW